MLDQEFISRWKNSGAAEKRIINCSFLSCAITSKFHAQTRLWETYAATSTFLSAQ